MSSYPINYDFGKNWESKVKQHLDNPLIVKAIKEGLEDYNRGFKNVRKSPIPCDHLSNDYYCMLYESKIDYIVNRLKRDKKLKNKVVLKIESGDNPDSKANIDNVKLFPDKETCLMHNVIKNIVDPAEQKDNIPADEDEMFEVWNEERERLHDVYFPEAMRKYDLESYVLLGGCRSWAPTFELALAKLVEPDEEWFVRDGEKHCTIINRSKTKVFDLLYWVLDGRMENYLFGKAIKKKDMDETLGGKLAFINSK
jgi:hypothetical protein